MWEMTLEADINGALRAGLQPVWVTYARDKKSLLPPGAVSDQVEIEDDNVPVISTWKELFSLSYFSSHTQIRMNCSKKIYMFIMREQAYLVNKLRTPLLKMSYRSIY
jgi:hypothetical protein